MRLPPGPPLRVEGWQSGLMRRTRNAVGRNPSEVQILYPPIKNMNNFSNENLISIALIFVAVLIGWLIALQIQVLGLRKKIKIFLKGKKVKDLEEVLSEQIKRMENIEDDIKDINKWNEKLQGICDISITKVGVIRFNPFKDTGGDQSFAIALLDSKNNGIVFSSLYGREGTRIYAKPISNADSTYNLSEEEKEAIKKAVIS